MGLDMYLTKRIFVGAQYKHREVTGNIEVKADGKPIKIDFSKIAYVEEAAAYWRKANQVHAWFVKNVQDGKDDCGDYYVAKDQIRELIMACTTAIETKRPDILPPQSGFFFGSTDVDEYYYEQLKNTVQMLTALDLDDSDASYHYRSSW
jgi:hypothetical protein